jgi:hypothetical protein
MPFGTRPLPAITALREKFDMNDIGSGIGSIVEIDILHFVSIVRTILDLSIKADLPA